MTVADKWLKVINLERVLCVPVPFKELTAHGTLARNFRNTPFQVSHVIDSCFEGPVTVTSGKWLLRDIVQFVHMKMWIPS
jgi:hypothetical protein